MSRYLQADFAEAGRGRPLRYRLTPKAVSVLGYSSLEELPVLPVFVPGSLPVPCSADCQFSAPSQHAGAVVFGVLSASFGAGALVGALIAAGIGQPSWRPLLRGGAAFSALLLALAPLHWVLRRRPAPR